jgi:hypothetical protein
MVDESVNGMVNSCDLKCELGDIELGWVSLGKKVVFQMQRPISRELLAEE